MQYTIEQAVFERFPEFRRVVVVARDVNNGLAVPALAERLRTEETRVRGDEFADFRARPELGAWCEAFRAMGLNPNRFPPSVVNLVKRVRSGKDLPYINALVTIFNCISLKYLLPCGGDDRNAVQGNLYLGLAKGTETYVPLGQPEVSEIPPAGEVIYYDSATLDVFCRALCWKNGDRSKLTAETTHAVINVDAMMPVSLPQARTAAEELAGLVRTHTGAVTTIHELSPETPNFTFSE